MLLTNYKLRSRKPIGAYGNYSIDSCVTTSPVRGAQLYVTNVFTNVPKIGHTSWLDPDITIADVERVWNVPSEAVTFDSDFHRYRRDGSVNEIWAIMADIAEWA